MRKGEEDWFFTAKHFKQETLVGSQLWVIEGRPSEGQYRLAAYGRITTSKPRPKPKRYGPGEGREVWFRFAADVKHTVDLSTYRWFRKVKGFLHFGMRMLHDTKIVQELERAARAARSPELPSDAAKRVQRAIKDRKGQPKFRKALLRAYRGKCAISGFDGEEGLEAAHIERHRNQSSNNVRNGLLLRADLHNLFDSHLITVNTEKWCVEVDEELLESAYKQYHGKPLRLPKSAAERPSA